MAAGGLALRPGAARWPLTLCPDSKPCPCALALRPGPKLSRDLLGQLALEEIVDLAPLNRAAPLADGQGGGLLDEVGVAVRRTW